MVLFNTPGLKLTLTESPEQGKIELLVRGKGYCIWPNREGEGFPIDGVYPVLQRENCLESGLTLSWPATAGTLAVALFPLRGSGLLFQIQTSEKGFHSELTLHSNSQDSLNFRFAAQPARREQWTTASLPERWLSSSLKGLKFLPKQFQVGLIGPDGRCGLPEKEGFRSLETLGKSILKDFPEETIPPVLHIFGYGAGHDRAYPDYSPSERLGGPSLLKETAAQLKMMGFRLSFYMNARLMETDQLSRYPRLRDGICLEERGKERVEEYGLRRFYVMDPQFPPWRDELLKQAQRLQSLGADLIQLDQVAGRAAAVPPGEIWGLGYNTLIESLHRAGLEVWIQGVSDYYQADCFEMTWRDLKILPGGILRGGNPFGLTDLTLIKALSFKGQLL
ncbi:DUF6259 domain-containing protein, partial [Oceanispirochaeta sp.]|uniref:DUF6259 domain-containing protein n=1 Tax=Oceanispirochaeta sp. TaxID=2035350 RepID=UPI00262FB51D